MFYHAEPDEPTGPWLTDPAGVARLSQTARPEEIESVRRDLFHGGHGVMWDFSDNAGLQELARTIWEGGGGIAWVCHGYCGL